MYLGDMFFQSWWDVALVLAVGLAELGFVALFIWAFSH